MKDIKLFFANIKKYHKYATRNAKAELKSEVADSYLNWLWWIIEPVCFMLIYAFVFGVIFKNSTPHFAAFIFIGLTCWELFNRMISGSVQIIKNNRDLVTKVYIPKYILLLSKSYTYLFKMFISLGISFILMAFSKVAIGPVILLVIPIIFIFYLLCFGAGMILMHFGVILDDLANLTRIALRMIFYISGVFYNIRLKLDGTIQMILLRANPAAFFMDEVRKVCLENKLPSFEGIGFWLLIALVLNFIGIVIIHHNENSYAKVI